MSFWDPWGDYPEAVRQQMRQAYPRLWRFSVAARVAFVIAAVVCTVVWGLAIAKVMSWP